MVWKQLKLRKTNINVISHIFSSKIFKKPATIVLILSLATWCSNHIATKHCAPFLLGSVEFFASVMHANPQKPTLSIEQLM